jgi:hypothetical protein
MLVTGIKSKPVYAPLEADGRGRFHLMLGLGVGRAPLLRVIAEIAASQPRALDATQVLYVPDATDAGAGADAAAESGTSGGDAPEFAAAGVSQVEMFKQPAPLLLRFRQILDAALMGTRLYVAGPEHFIGLAMKTALEYNLNKDEIRAEECGTRARRVYCIHCRSTAEQVRTNIVACAGCGRWLLVRDHYSRRLAAYMGVMVDAEAPGELPPVVEAFL